MNKKTHQRTTDKICVLFIIIFLSIYKNINHLFAANMDY